MDINQLFSLVVKQFEETSWLEWLGIVTTLACIYLAAKEHILNWPVSIIACGAYSMLYYQYKLYGDSYLQIYFLITAIYGWVYWLRKKQQKDKPVVSLTSKEWLYTVFAITFFTIALSKYLDKFTDTDVPYADGFCTAMSFVAQFLMTRKVIQNWILWIIVDLCYVPLLLYKDLAFTALLYLILVGLAAKGYFEWKKTWKLAQ
ncbi:nicotinamide riboside transporter PnuC [Desertivirga brevis]|uniref:nicotinamide riboside transporter PnuC n=1 Tax=Desertivirga brevis TaxID=2810310 RepID=UPI001A96FF1B|nr:nicotinamide riboside transporter PnuC [Pedobacter sp. SYSU D00873]